MEVNGIGNQQNDYLQMNPGNAEMKAMAASLLENEMKSKKVQGEDQGEQKQPLSEEEQQRRMERLHDTLKNHNVEISYNEEVNRYAIKVLDADSKEVVKEIPSEKTLEMFARMLEIEGLLVDERR